jgi:hypothetical protein
MAIIFIRVSDKGTSFILFSKERGEKIVPKHLFSGKKIGTRKNIPTFAPLKRIPHTLRHG